MTSLEAGRVAGRAGGPPPGFSPRRWAEAAWERYLAHPGVDFSVNACPGAGKTRFAAMLAWRELSRGAFDRVDLVAPSTHICGQWARELAAWGIHLDPENPTEARDCQGRVLTYQRLGNDPEAFRLRRSGRTLVILDEIHHAGDARTWGDGLRHAFQGAGRRLLLSGTPFRSDNRRIPFVEYSQGGHGLSLSHFTYGYGEALRDGYCAPVFFPHHDGELRWERGEREHRAGLSDRLGARLAADRLRTAFEPGGDFVRGVLEAAHAHLLQLRQGHPEAAGILFARDVSHARALADALARISGRPPVTVTNEDLDAGTRLRRFRASSNPWIVSVKMVSEGVDLPRLRIGVYLTNIGTEMFFRQAVGRLVRRVPGIEDQAGHFYLPSLPDLLRFARDMQRERRHAVRSGAPGAPGARGERPEREGLPGQDGAPGDYRFLASRGEQRGVVEAREVPSAGGQGLFEFAWEEAREALRRRRAQLGSRPLQAEPEPTPLHERKEQARRRGGRISGLVREVHQRLGLPFGQIHARLNAAQGVLSQAACTLAQLEQRERLLELWSRTGYPPQSAR